MVNAPRDLLLLFGREPLPGRVKTRLVPPLDREEAAALYGAFLGDVAGRPRPFGVTLFVAPPFDRDRLAAFLPPGMPIEEQHGPDLGTRLADAVARAFEGGARRVVVRNTDSPLLSLEREEDAFHALADGAEIVLAPDLGGGYALVGLDRPQPRLFADLPMSVPSNYARTLLRARELSARVVTLPPEPDVDTGADLESLAQVFMTGAAARAFAPRTAECVLALVGNGRIRVPRARPGASRRGGGSSRPARPERPNEDG